jgi:hypothetical protein
MGFARLTMRSFFHNRESTLPELRQRASEKKIGVEIQYSLTVDDIGANTKTRHADRKCRAPRR